MNALSGVGPALASVGVATAVWGGTGLALGLVSGGLAGINKPSDGFEDMKPSLKLLGAGVGVMALGGVTAGLSRGGPLGMVGGAAVLAGGFAAFMGAVGTGIEIAD